MTKVYSKMDEYGNIRWYKEGTYLLHRDDGPAVEYLNGDKVWYQNGELHRIDGPAINHFNGSKWWIINGKLHRTEGPALEYEDGDKEYWLNNKHYSNIKTNEEWIIFQIIN